ncbi:restriction endonuclease subunit S [Thermomonas brevis]
MASKLTKFRDVLSYAIGGGWGTATADPKHTIPVSVIRGTDFARLSSADIAEIPRRYEAAAKVAKRTLEPGDILLEISGGSPTKGQTTGRTCFIDGRALDLLQKPVIPASFCRLVRVDSRKIFPRYGYYWLQDMYKSGRAAEYENQSTGISNFQFERFLDAEAINLPSLDEQQEISEVLGALDARIDCLRQTNATLESIAQALFKSWFVDFDPVRAKANGREPEGMDAATADLFPGEFEESEMDLIPKGWQTQSVYETAQFINGAAYKAFNPNTERRGRPIIKIAELKSGVTVQTAFSDADMPSRYHVESGDILFSWSGNPDTSIDTFVWHREAGLLNQHIFRVVPFNASDRSRVLVMLKFLRPLFSERARNKQTTGLGHVTVGDLKEMRVVLPSPEVAASWNRIVDPLMERALITQIHARTLEDLRDTLLPRLISGRLRLPDDAPHI